MLLRYKAHDFLNKSATQIEETQKKLFYNEEYRGFFALGLKHQKLAVIYYDLNRYNDAICHSERARNAVYTAWQEHNRPIPRSWELNPDEKGLVKACPMFNILDSNLYKYTPQLETEDEPYIGKPLKRIRAKI